LSVHHLAIINPEEFLIQMSSILQLIFIEQQLPRIGRLNTIDFFGIHNDDWARIIINMLSRKLDKLYINNHDFSRFISSHCAHNLTQRLPMLGKKIWFQAYRVHSDEPIHVYNNHLVKVDNTNIFGRR
ncbi:hypothetical protein PENTCL1PPCAC_8131, partial [Pristionchus entomophagus]